MWLINTASLVLEFVEDPETCVYAILSHTWGDGEVSFQDMANIERARKKLGFSKIERTYQLARNRNIEYAWGDTCCIDKSSSGELTEAINSMFHWYKQSHICFVFLSDLLSIDRNVVRNDLLHCRWFTRGWTLQELIAPGDIEFYGQSWNLVGTNNSLRKLLPKITGIDSDILLNSYRMHTIPVARRMSWAASRQTTRVEDLAYCLFGIFDVNLPLIYGEGKKSFIRLQEAIARETNDLSLFAWTSQDEGSIQASRRQRFRGILAESPAEFKGRGNLLKLWDPGVLPAEISITNRGFSITNRLSDSTGNYHLRLDCAPGSNLLETIVIKLVRTSDGFVRQHYNELVTAPRTEINKSAAYSLPIPKSISPADSEKLISELRCRFALDFISDIPCLDVKIQRKPLHLWDHVTQTFITCGSPIFTGMIELSATANLHHNSGSESFANTFNYALRLILVFGLQSVWRSDEFSPTAQSTGRAVKEPWAGLYTDQGTDEISRALSDLLSQEHTVGFPHFAREAREFVLSRASANGKMQTTCEHIVNAVLVGSGLVPVYDPKEDKLVQSTLRVETEETSEFTVHYLRLNVKNPLGTGRTPYTYKHLLR